MEDDVLKDDELEHSPEDEEDRHKKILDGEAESLDDAVEEELDVEEPYDDVDEM
ncbi:MAG: hypothetical protein HYS51_01545 [Candidatus Zambryskibacteria bacterium]|nr:hypothetical protein [Candidatus Zambryskibacteria bacterium]